MVAVLSFFAEGGEVARQARRLGCQEILTGDQAFFTLDMARPSDLEDLYQLVVACFGQRAWSWKAWREVVCWPGWTCLVLRLGASVRAAMVLLLWPPVAQLSSVAVHPSYQRRGLGRWLVREAIVRARRAGCRWLALEVDRDSPAVRLYRRLGFGLVRRLREDGLMRLEMARRLRRLR